jgi:hypothetical protein
MAIELLAVRNAKAHMQSYSRESDDLMARRIENMDGRDCEAYLQMGIESFDWLIRADRLIRLNVYRGKANFDAEAESAIQELCQIWLKPVAFAEQWIANQQSRGYEVSNLAAFRHRVEEMSAIVEAIEDATETLPTAIVQLRDEALQEHRDGETAEFF